MDSIHPSLDSSRHFLGDLCIRGHDWHGTGRSLRKIRNRSCLECERIYDRNRTKRGRGKERYAKGVELTNQIKMERGCADCGYREHPAALEFDHLPGTEKAGTIAKMVGMVTLPKLLAEIEKCEVVCANCHAIRGWNRRREDQS